MDSGLYMLKGFIGIYYRGVYGSAVVKQHRYRPEGIYRYKIKDHFEKKKICEHDFHPGNCKGVEFDKFLYSIRITT